MLEYGTVTGLPGKYRITLAISIALLLHTLVMATLPFTVPDMESHRQTVRVELVSAGSVPLPESVASATTQTVTAASEGSAADSVPTPDATEPDVVATHSPQSPTRQHEPEPSAASTSRSPSEEPRSPALKSPSRDSRATAAGNPEQAIEDEPEAITRMTRSPENADPYVASLAVHIGKELDKRPVPSSHSVTEPVISQLELKLLPSGALTSAKVTRSTGFGEIDKAVYQSALLASPYPKPPEEYSGRKRFRVELIFAPERL